MVACVAETDLTELLQPTDPPDLRLVRLLLRGIGTRELPLTHDTFDTSPIGQQQNIFTPMIPSREIVSANAQESKTAASCS